MKILNIKINIKSILISEFIEYPHPSKTLSIFNLSQMTQIYTDNCEFFIFIL